ncbi:acyltransferase family protein [Muribaculum intestinale]|uniref:acyltransferase family protein n=1 Tax=Muribaculum intestinale TaxID=1796646 RepID=UPI0025AA1698|nr:acyltransferase family protein [Muribaculum intestinale]
MRAREIDIIRAFVVIALVAYHSLAPYAGGWQPITDGASFFDYVYKWLGHFAYAGMLETFTAISGFVFGLVECKKSATLKVLVSKKLRRLYVPALIWGLIYYILFVNESYGTGLWRIINGIGHLWYLPMLFWCFILEKYIFRKSPIWIIILIAVIPWPELPLQFNNSLYYLLFFHIGYLISEYKHQFINYLNLKRCTIILMMAISILVASTIWRDNLDLPLMSKMIKAVHIFAIRFLRILYSVPIVLAYFYLGFRLRNTRYYNIFLFLSECSFGVYILQEFIIRILYYKLDIPNSIETIIPFIGFCGGFLGSLLIVWCCRRFKVANLIF